MGNLEGKEEFRRFKWNLEGEEEIGRLGGIWRVQEEFER